jgi:hypothetical protein
LVVEKKKKKEYLGGWKGALGFLNCCGKQSEDVALSNAVSPSISRRRIREATATVVLFRRCRS